MTFTNSFEAWKNSYVKGCRVFDADLNFTSDGVLVLRHSWEDDLGQAKLGSGIVPDYKTFMNSPIYPERVGGSLTPMDADMMLEFIQEHPDVYVACDAKADTFSIYKALSSLAQKRGVENVLGRTIVSVYNSEEKAAALRAWSFTHFAMRYYNDSYFGNFDEVLAECRKGSFPVCMVADYYLADGRWRILRDGGISVWAAVVDEHSEWKRLKSLGISGCVTNFLFDGEPE